MQLQGISIYMVYVDWVPSIFSRAKLLGINQSHRYSLNTTFTKKVHPSTTMQLSTTVPEAEACSVSDVVQRDLTLDAPTFGMTWRWQDGGNNGQTRHQQCEVRLLLGWHSDLPPPHPTPAIVENKQGFQNQPSGRTRDQTWNLELNRARDWKSDDSNVGNIVAI